MLAYVVIAVASLFTAGLTLYSGFGLGTLLMPVFALFFPVEVAVAATAVVHGANNAFKIILVGKHADGSLVWRFGGPAIIAAFAGAAALGYVSHIDPLATYSVGSRTAVVTPVKLVIAVMILVFALFERLPSLREIKFDRKHLVWGGLLSGFFGGFSGHQGALRSAFLVKVGIDTRAFVGTNAVIGFMVDLARTIIYAAMFFLAGASNPIQPGQWGLILTGVVSAFAGVYVAQRWLHRVPIHVVQKLTGVLLGVIAVALGAGWL